MLFRLCVGTALVVAGLALCPLAPAAQPASPPPPWARVDGALLTAEEIEGPVGVQIYKLETELAAIRRKAMDDAITRRLLEREAERQGLSVEALLAREVDAKAQAPTGDEIKELLERRRREVGIAAEQEQVIGERLALYLAQQKKNQQRERYVAGLRAQAKIETAMPEARAMRLAVSTEGEPSLGPAAAPVTIVEFSDYQ